MELRFCELGIMLCGVSGVAFVALFIYLFWIVRESTSKRN